MKTITTTILAGGLMALSLGFAAVAHEPVKELVINSEEGPIRVTVEAKGQPGSPLETVYSGWVFRSEETQALEMDDFDNPGMIFVEQAWEAWNTPEGTAGKSCADCHGDPGSMKGLRAVLPRWDDKEGRIMTLEDYINRSRVKYMGAKEWKYGGGQLTSMVALISMQSRGMPVNVSNEGKAREAWELGKKLYYTRVGQLDMSCANCHEDNYGKYIRADHLSQGQINGFPAYRLKNAKLNSVHGRFKGCMKNIRATPYKVGSDEFRALELYVAWRGNGLSVEGPSVRN